MSDTVSAQPDAIDDDYCETCDDTGWVRCNDWVQCTRRHVGEGPEQEHVCPTCQGIGGPY